MRKNLFVSLLLMLLLFTACGAPAEEPQEEPAATEAPKEEPTEEPKPTEEAEPEEEPTEAASEDVDTGSSEASEGIKTACLVTDLGNVNDGTFNEFAYNGMIAAAEEYGLETNFIETQSETDYAKNIDTCVQEGFDAIITVGFLIADATLAAAEANPETMFIGVDQFFESPPDNLVGIQYREDQGGFLAGALACMMTESNVVGGVYGIDIPPVIKFRNGFENGCAYVNPDATTLGVYVPSFTDSAQGASTAEQFMGEGADVIFGAGGPTGSGGIRNAAEQGIYVIGVDQDEYNTTFGGGSAPGADQIISSAVKRVDLGVQNQLAGLADPTTDLWAGGGLYILNAANGGITYADFHDAAADIPAAVQTRLEEIREMLAAEELTTGVDPVSGEILDDEIPQAVPFDPDAMGEESEGSDSDEAMADGEGIKTACLVTDLGNVNDGTFNEFAYNGMLDAEKEFGLETTFIETQSETDYAKNIDTCVQEGYDAIITVGFLIADATLAAAEANPETMFIGVDQFFESPPDNLVGIQYREDQGGFLAGALACMMTESNVVGGVYGIDIPPVIKFRNGFENGCAYVNPDATTLGVYVPSFTDSAQGASTAEQFMGEGADVIFGAGGPTGSGGIRNAAEQGIYVIGVDQDEYNTTFGGGSAPGADKIISSAVKRVDLGVRNQLAGLADPGTELWAGGGLYILDAANGGITYADFHDAEADIPAAVQTRLEEIREMLAAEELTTGVDPVSGEIVEDEIPEAMPFDPNAVSEEAEEGDAMADGEGIKTACLVTDLGNVNDGTFNEFAYNGMLDAEKEFGLETTFIETQSETDYAKNIDTCVQEGFDAIITVGFLIADATLAAAEANPETMFIGVDQFFESPPDNLVGIQYREDQGGFLAGALACMMTESNVVGGVYGIDIPPVIKFRNGFENGCAYVNPDATTLGVYVPSFTDSAQGASTAEQFMGEGADVIFGAGGPTGSGGIRNAAEQGIYVIGVDQDEYNTTFGGGSAPGADKIISSAVKRVDLGVRNQLAGLADPGTELWAGGGLYILDAANGGITYADFHDAAADIPEAVQTRLEEIRELLAAEELTTGVDPVSGEIVEDEIPEAVPFEK